MKTVLVLFAAIIIAGCSDTVPEVRYLVDPSLSKVSSKSFVQADATAVTTVTATGYTGTIMVHAGNNGALATSTDGEYQLSIRKISY